MTASNHAITGAVIALAIPRPEIALPLAVASHFVLDSLPHFGNHPKIPVTSQLFLYILAADAAVTSAVFLTIGLFLPTAWLLPVIAAIFAMSPDLMWFPNFVRQVTGRKLKKPNIVTVWHKRIQRFERPWGMYVEVVWFLSFIPLFFSIMVSG
jgi:hypothetical protein